MASFVERIRKGWNAFRDAARDEYNNDYTYKGQYSPSYSTRPGQFHFTRGNERTLVNAVYTRIAMDAAGIDVKHCTNDENGDFLVERKDSALNYVLTCEANRDQTARELRQDIIQTMFDEGVAAVVPTDADVDPNESPADIYEMRVGVVTQWKFDRVKVKLINDFTGQYEEVWFRKGAVAIIQNPFYTIMNEPNSLLKRLIRKLALLDAIDEESGSGKLDLIIQLPYSINSTRKEDQAEKRRKNLEDQLKGSKFGIGYIDSTEHITQLNRSVENNLMKQIEYLTEQLYAQLGLTTEILNGTANEEAMTNYNNRTIEPVMSAIVDEMNRKFLTKTARTQGQAIRFFRDPFKLMSVTSIADAADKFTRNEIMSSNEFRVKIGLPPSQQQGADELRNKNINQSGEEAGADQAMLDTDAAMQMSDEEYEAGLKMFGSIDDNLDSLEEEAYA